MNPMISSSTRSAGLRIAFAGCAALLLTANMALAEKIALVNGTLINPGSGKIVSNAIVVIDGDHISAVGDQATAISIAGAKIVDCKGKFILPGYIDTHVHFFQSGDIYTRPDAVDLNSVRPYKDEVAWIKSHLDDTYARYLR